MAQTIQIRRGTGSAVPSSLAAGELAINTETGKFYYGNGSAVSSDFRVDSITAESYTVSSSVTSYTFQALSGSTDFGDDIGDIHNRTGSVNVSGSMSIATDLVVAGNLSVALGDGVSNHIKLGNSTLGTTGGFLISGSSLGNPLITLKQSAQTVAYGAPGIKFQRIASSDGSAIGLITYNSPDSAGTETTYVRVTGNIEENQSGQEGGKYTVEVASHDGELQPGLTIEDGAAEDEIDVTIGNTTTSLTTIAGNLSIGNSITSNITASGNISSSGEIEANTFKAAGNVDFNGDLDVDGTTNLDAVDIDGTTNLGGTVFLGTNGSGVSQYFYSDTTGKFAYWSDGYHMFNFSDNTYLSFGTITGPGRGDMNFYYNGSRLVLEDYIGDNILHISSSDTAQLIVDGHITASGNISASGDIIGNAVYVDNSIIHNGDTDTKIQFTTDDLIDINTGGSVRIRIENDGVTSTGRLKVNSNITASGDISSSGAIIGNTMTVETDGQAQMLISTTNAFTNRDVGLTLSASSNGQQYTLGLNRPSNTFVIAPTDVNSAPENAVFELDAVGNITASGNISASGAIIAASANITDYGDISSATIRLTSTTDASVSSTGHAFQVGATNSTNVIMDNNEIMARNNGAVADLHVNPDGGNITFNNSVSDKVRIGSGHVTASGNISSSGTIKSKFLNIPLSYIGDGSDSSIIFGDGDPSTKGKIYDDGSALIFNYDDTDAFQFTDSLVTNNLNLEIITTTDATDASGDTGALRVEGGASIAKKVFIGTQLSVGSHITASGNISSSGEIEANTFKAAGNVAVSGGLDVNGTTNLDAVDIDGNVQLDGTLTVGFSGTGHDVTLFGETHGKFIKWDQSEDLLEIFAETNFGQDGTGADITFFGDTNGKYMKWDQSQDHLKLYDNTNLVFGTGVFNEADFDASIFWDTADLVIDSETDIKLVADGGNVDVTGNLSVSAAATASTGSFDVMTKALNIIPFAYYVSSVHTSELYIPVAGSLSESNFDQYYHMFHAPYNGVVKRIALSWQSGTPGDSTIRVRKASNFDLDDSGDIVETVVISSAAQDTMYYADFSASFSKGDVVAFTVQQSGTDNSYIGGTIAMEFDTSS